MEPDPQFESPRDPQLAQLVFEAAALFFTRHPGADPPTASHICEILRQKHPTAKLSRESIYPLLARALAYGYVRFVPPREQVIAGKVQRRYPRAKHVVVVNARGPEFTEAVGAAAADVAAGLLLDLKARGYSTVGLGLGPGKSALDFTISLSRHLEASTDLPRLDLFGITAGCIPTAPELAPVSFFNLFPKQSVHRRMAIWAETLVQADQMPRLKADVVGVKEAFEAKQDIRLVVTGLGDAADEHDMLGQFFNASVRKVRKPAMIGNVQYRPFSEDGPVREKKQELRAVTLFELDELVTMSKEKDRYVILLARQCGLCKKNRARVLRCLLGRDDLAVFTHLVMDLETADELLKE